MMRYLRQGRYSSSGLCINTIGFVRGRRYDHAPEAQRDRQQDGRGDGRRPRPGQETRQQEVRGLVRLQAVVLHSSGRMRAGVRLPRPAGAWRNYSGTRSRQTWYRAGRGTPPGRRCAKASSSLPPGRGANTAVSRGALDAGSGRTRGRRRGATCAKGAGAPSRARQASRGSITVPR